MLSHILMRQSSARCFGPMFNGVSAQSSQISINKFIGLASAATQSVQRSAPPSAFAGTPSPQMQRWITTFQRKQVVLQTSATGSRGMSTNHPKIWTVEKLVSLAMVPAIVLPFVWTTPLTDAIFCTLGVLHSHWGVEAIVVDYIRPVLFGGNTIIPNICHGLVWALSAFTLGALYYFNYTDVGIVNAIKMLWTV